MSAGFLKFSARIRDRLIPCDDVPRLSRGDARRAASNRTAERDGMAEDARADHVIKNFTISAMVDATVAGYRDALRAREAGLKARARLSLKSS